jgi:hypothetical protein
MEHRKKRPLPPHNRVPRNLDEGRRVMEITSYTVASWTPERDGKGKAEAVMLAFEINGIPFDFAVRLKNPAAVDELVEALQRSKFDVWPDAK